MDHFFFQAEDGIRCHCVTGVQTCALPISLRPREPLRLAVAALQRARPRQVRALRAADRHRSCAALESRPASRSEERRVGKECGYSMSADLAILETYYRVSHQDHT